MGLAYLQTSEWFQGVFHVIHGFGEYILYLVGHDGGRVQASRIRLKGKKQKGWKGGWLNDPLNE